ncbi:GTPase-activating protein gyp8 [Diatrype stigma]|uniref:GTPase-activating protein gyp8 n=1 Tax=Diatrype stigma TaxID=117547 RepID=A0AAN9UCQ5_9PEZI
MSVKEEEDDHEHSRCSESPRSLSSLSDEKGALSDDVEEDEKTKRILAACETRNIGELQELAMSKGGFLSDANRALAWPILLGAIDSWGSTDLDGKAAADPVPGAEGEAEEEDWRNLPPHRDEAQVKLDVDRSFVYYPNDNSPTELDAKKAELSDLITEVLRRQPHLCYFQGYHDICQVFLLVLPADDGGNGPSAATSASTSSERRRQRQRQRALAVARLSALRIRDFMLPSLGPAVAQLRLIPEVLGSADPALAARLRHTATEPYFALADTLTMFAHNVRRLAAIARLFDALLAREPAFALYVFARLALDRSPDLVGDARYRADPDMLHFALSKLPQSPALDLDRAVAGAARLLADHPPHALPAWRWRPWWLGGAAGGVLGGAGISRNSVLRTARDVERCAREQSLADGRRFFDAQLRELRRAERCDVLRRRYDTWPNRIAAVTVLVGVAAALYAQRTGPSGLGWGWVSG